MINLSFAEFNKMSRKGNLVALWTSVPADLETPVSCFMKLAQASKYAYLLESAEQAEQIGRYSIIGLEPEFVLEAKDKKLKILRRGKKIKIYKNIHALDFIQKEMQSQKLANPEKLSGFLGGYVGFLSYENVEYFETIRLRRKSGLQIPDSVFYLTRHFVVFDHFRKTLTVVIIVDIKSGKSLNSLYASAQREIDARMRLLQKPLPKPGKPQKVALNKLQSNMTKKSFRDKINKIKEYIRAGDCIQIVLSQRFRLPAIRNDFQIYRALRSVNPSPYMFYFKCGNIRLIGSSPELLVRKRGLLAAVRPIAGTRPRGANPSEDLAFEERLKKSPKERAEHLMLVDLGRNDLGRVCSFDSIKVEKFARVERYSHVMHLVSDVSGKLKPGKTRFDLLKATFPAGTVSGAPKIRAMQIIDELEEEKRGAYAGSLGFFSYDGDMEMCITIRTIVITGNQMYLQAGAGVVKDSNPAREYQETVNKARALLKAIELQQSY